MNLLQEFLAWRTARKQRETLATSWAAPYVDHPETEARRVHTIYKITNPMMLSDKEALNAWCDHKGLYTVEQKANTK